MPQEITQISEVELRNALEETYADILRCEAAIRLGIEQDSEGDSVQERLEVNRAIKQKIEAELERRKVASPLDSESP